MPSLFSGGNGGFVCTHYKVSETKSAAISYLNAAVTLQFYTRFGKLVMLLLLEEKKKPRLLFVVQ